MSLRSILPPVALILSACEPAPGSDPVAFTSDRLSVAARGVAWLGGRSAPSLAIARHCTGPDSFRSETTSVKFGVMLMIRNRCFVPALSCRGAGFVDRFISTPVGVPGAVGPDPPSSTM